MKSIKQFIVDVNVRTFPTTFIIAASLPEKDLTDATKLTRVKAAMVHMSELYDAVKHPGQAVISMLKDTYYVALICEVCLAPPEDTTLWYPVTKPRETVGKILPLANAGLQVATLANAVSGLGRIFGLPTPVLSDMAFLDAQRFLEKLSRDSLHQYPMLQQHAQQMYESADKEAPRGNKFKFAVGYCVREFGLFLQEVDPRKTWAHLSARVNDVNGDLCFVCPICVRRNSSTSSTGGRGKH